MDRDRWDRMWELFHRALEVEPGQRQGFLDRAEDLLPDEYLTVELHHLEETKRRIVLHSPSQRFIDLLEAFKQAAFAK